MRGRYLWLVGIFFFAASGLSAPLRLMTEDFPPFAYYSPSGQVEGLAVEVVRALQAKVANQSVIEILPWARAIEELEHNNHRALFCVARTAAREDKFAWVGPLFGDGVYLVKRRGQPLMQNQLSDAKEWSQIAVTRNYPEHLFLQQAGFNNLVLSKSPEHSIRLLLSGRVDALAIGEFAMPPLLQRMGVDAQLLEQTHLKLFDVELYLAFSKDTEMAELQRWQQALAQLGNEGELEAILVRYRLKK